jgi:hypothetical protein
LFPAGGNDWHYTFGTARPSPDPLRAIRRVTVTLTTTASRSSVPVGTINPTYTLTASVMPQNMENPESALDALPPATPLNLNVIDSRSCTTKLQAKWVKNTELDLAGYVLFYGATAKQVYPLAALADKNNPAVWLNPADLFITKNAVRTTSPNRYDIEIVAYDSSGNYSARSAAVSGNPASDVTAFVSPFPVPPATVSASANDTTVNPLKPSKPTGMTVTATTGSSGELVIVWQAPTDGTATAGYRLYRSLTPFTSGSVIPDTAEIANETTLTTGVTTYTDTGLLGCTTYYYAVASVNCDETLVATYRYNTTASASDYAAANNDGATTPLDDTDPPPPTLAGHAGWKRVFLSLDNPTATECPDFNRTELWFSKAPAGEPTVDLATGIVTGGARLPDRDHASIVPPETTVVGSFNKPGSQTVIFDSVNPLVPDPTTPQLDELGVYTVLPVSFDRCGNVSTSAAGAYTLILCGDELTGPLHGPPPDTWGAYTASSCQLDTVDLGWEYPPKYYTGAAAITDFAGYRVFRTNQDTTARVELTTGPWWLETWTDSGALVAGGAYSYEIRATDCAFENHNAEFPDNISLPLNIGLSNPIYPGRLEHYANSGTPLAIENFVTTVSDATQPYTYHNNVTFHFQNTSRANMLLERIAATWDNPNVVLDQIVIGGGSSTTTERTISAAGATSGSPVTVNVLIEDHATGIGAPSGPVPVRLRFTTPSGTVSRLVDMRSEAMEISLWTQNESLTPALCPNPDQFTLDVPAGPVLGGFSQDAPGIFGIDSYEVIGQNGTARDTDMKVPGGRLVNVFGWAFDNSGAVFADGANRGFSTLKVVSIETTAANLGVTPVMPATGSFEDNPLQSLGGNRYAIFDTSTLSGARFPMGSNTVRWYYALAIDATGNWDRVPNPDFGNYAYFQPAPNVCDFTPEPPVLDGVATPFDMMLTWIPPTQYQDIGVEIPLSDYLKYSAWYSHTGLPGSFTRIVSVPQTDAAGVIDNTVLSYTADMVSPIWYFAVTARNSCSPPNESAFSNTVRECQGANAVYCSQFTFPSTALFGDPIALSIANACYYKNLATTDKVTFRVTSGATTKDFLATESGAQTGTFTTTIYARETGGTGANEILAADGSTLQVALLNQAGTVVHCTGPSPAHGIAISGGACGTFPNPPTLGSAARLGNTSMRVSWTVPGFNTDGTTLIDLQGFEIQYMRCNDTGTCAGWPTTWTTYPFINNPGATSQDITGLTDNYRYRVRMRSKDTCTPAPPSGSTNYSPTYSNVVSSGTL